MSKRDQQQVGALCFRRTSNNSLDVLLVTSRDTGRWIIPKGWPKKGDTLCRSAAREAFEEAGVHGAVGSQPIGEFPYMKHEKDCSRQLDVSVFTLLVKNKEHDWPEAEERKRKWFAVGDAAEKVEEPELAELIKGLAKKNNKKKKLLPK